MDCNNKKKDKDLAEDIEETTKYDEFVCKFDKWLPLDKQKENAKKLENITKK